MTELADVGDLKSSEETLVGSSPTAPTKAPWKKVSRELAGQLIANCSWCPVACEDPHYEYEVCITAVLEWAGAPNG